MLSSHLKEEQKRRLIARLDDPTKRWKYNPADIDERVYWDDYQQAYSDALRRCNTEAAPWFTVPADRRWYRNWAVTKFSSSSSRRWPSPGLPLRAGTPRRNARGWPREPPLERGSGGPSSPPRMRCKSRLRVSEPGPPVGAAPLPYGCVHASRYGSRDWFAPQVDAASTCSNGCNIWEDLHHSGRSERPQSWPGC